MGFWRSVFSNFKREQRAWTEADPVLARFLNTGISSKTGLAVGLNSALRVATVLACARVMSEDVAAMPFRPVRQGTDGFQETATDHPLYDLMETGPNDWQTGYEFRETLMMHLMLAGNAFAYKNIVRGKILELLPFTPGQVTVRQDDDYTLTYLVNSQGTSRTFTSEQIWHVRGPSMNTYMGLDIVQQAREAIGLAMATEETHAALHRNGVRASGMYSVEGTLNEAEYGRLQKWLEKTIAGLQNTGKPFIVDRAAKWQPTTITGLDAEHLATRNHQIEEICRAMRVIPIMVGYSDKTATYASAEQMFIAHNNIVGKWCRRLDNSGDKHLLTKDERRRGLQLRHQINALLYADTKAKSAWYTALYMIGAINPNEIRGFEHMKPYAEGDQYRVPVNMVDPGKEAQAITDVVKKMVEDPGMNWLDFKEKLANVITEKHNGNLPPAKQLIDRALGVE